VPWHARHQAFRETYDTLRQRQREGGPFLSAAEFREVLALRAACASRDFRVNLANGIPTVRDLGLTFGFDPAEFEEEPSETVREPPTTGRSPRRAHPDRGGQTS
jgi:hypothetical protein